MHYFYFSNVVKEEVGGLGDKLTMGNEGGWESNRKSRLQREMLLADIVTMQGDEGLGGKTRRLVLLSLRWAIQPEMSAEQSVGMC